MGIWYILGLNSLYGIAAYLYAHKARFTQDGKDCADVQVFRSGFLYAEVIIFWLTFHIMSIPHFFFIFLKKDNLEDALTNGGEESEEEGEKN